MSKVTSDMAVSVDGFVAGPNQSLNNPFGEGVALIARKRNGRPRPSNAIVVTVFAMTHFGGQSLSQDTSGAALVKHHK